MLLDPATRAALSVEGRYYLGSADPTTGGEIYRSADGQKWERVADKVSAAPTRSMFTPSVGFAGQVYVVGTSMRGFDVVRRPTAASGRRWSRTGSASVRTATSRRRSLAYGEALYLATQNNDPRVLIPTQPRERFPVQGFQLYRSTDGAGWTKIGDDGFGDSGNFAATLTVENGVLYLSTANYKSGPQVFTSTDGREWNRVFSLEEPSPFNEMGGLVLFDKHVVQAVNDLSKGLSLWREDAEAVAATGDVTTTSAPTTTEPAATTSSAVPATATTGATGAGGSGGGDVDQGGSSGVGWATITLGVVAALAVIGVAVLAAVLLLGRRRTPGSDGNRRRRRLLRLLRQFAPSGGPVLPALRQRGALGRVNDDGRAAHEPRRRPVFIALCIDLLEEEKL